MLQLQLWLQAHRNIETFVWWLYKSTESFEITWTGSNDTLEAAIIRNVHVLAADVHVSNISIFVVCMDSELECWQLHFLSFTWQWRQGKKAVFLMTENIATVQSLSCKLSARMSMSVYVWLFLNCKSQISFLLILLWTWLAWSFYKDGWTIVHIQA